MGSRGSRNQKFVTIPNINRKMKIKEFEGGVEVKFTIIFPKNSYSMGFYILL